MPELPEVETMCRGIAEIVGRRIAGFEVPECHYRPIRIQPAAEEIHRKLSGSRVTEVRRLGKRVVIVTATHHLVFEPRMTGLVLLTDPPDETHLRGALRFERGKPERLWFWDRRGLSTLHLLTPDELERKWGSDVLGPDPLTIDPRAFEGRFVGCRRPVKVALLDQARIAGVGNLYASEALHACGLHPELLCDQLHSDQWTHLHKALVEVLLTAIRYEGSTLGDGTYRNALNQDGSYQNEHRVYARDGEKCRTCGKGTIRRIVQAQRSTFFCEACQPLSRSRKRGSGKVSRRK